MFACNVVSQNCKKETSPALKNSLLLVCCHNQTWQDGRATCTDLTQKVALCIIMYNFKRFQYTQYTFHSLTTSKAELDTQYKKLYTRAAERVDRRIKTQAVISPQYFRRRGLCPHKKKKTWALIKIIRRYQQNLKTALGDSPALSPHAEINARHRRPPPPPKKTRYQSRLE